MTRPKNRSGWASPTWWTAERRAEAAATSSARWRERYPERASVRDGILEAEQPQPCADCESTDDVRLWVTDYTTGAHDWRCKPCASAARREGGSS